MFCLFPFIQDNFYRKILSNITGIEMFLELWNALDKSEKGLDEGKCSKQW